MDRYNLDYKLLAERIKIARKEKGYSQSKLAELAGVSTNTIAKLEINYTTVALKTILSIANVLDVDINFLIGNNKPDTEQKIIDVYIDKLLYDFTDKDKQLLIDIINSIKSYKK